MEAAAAAAAPQPHQPHIAIFSTTGKGHLFPLIELARKFIHLHAFSATIILPHDGFSFHPQTHLPHPIPALNFIALPPLNFTDIPPDAPIEISIELSITRSIPHLCKALKDLNASSRLTAFITDGFGSQTVSAVQELGFPAYIIHTSTAMALALARFLPELDKSCTYEYRLMPEPVSLPGCPPLRGSDFFDPARDRTSQSYKFILEVCRNMELAEGILVNSCLEFEPETFKSFGSTKYPSVYAVGPLTRPVSGDRAECLEWLDKQPDGSVLYVAFGSGGTLSAQQLKELAKGLEMSGQRFLMVVRKPNDVVRNGAYFSSHEQKSSLGEYLPPGFLQRVEGKGFVVGEWAPQVEVLSHAAVGGFVTYCGWNSTLESIVQGVPLIAWPLFAEQRTNAVLVSEGLKVAERVREDENGVVDGEQISRMVRRLMVGEEGAEMRRRMAELRDAAERAMGEGGSSMTTLAGLAEKWK